MILLPAATLLLTLPQLADAHGLMQVPVTWYDDGGRIGNQTKYQCNPKCLFYPENILGPDCGCYWFSNNTEIPGEAVLEPDSPLLTFKYHKKEFDTSKYPWMAPGTAEVFSPCGIYGGNPKGCPEGDPRKGACPGAGYAHGPDAREWEFKNVVVTPYKVGEDIEVIWGINSNHGGGYSYRLCKLPEEGKKGLTEECFQNLTLPFSGTTQWIQFDNGTRVAFKGIKTSNNTFPHGSEWMRNPVPACRGIGGGSGDDDAGCPGGLQFAPPVPGVYGFGLHGIKVAFFPNETWDFTFSIVDRVRLPAGLDPGRYVFSQRWDCEQTAQVWTSCADVDLFL